MSEGYDVSALDGGVSPAGLDLLRKGNKIAAITQFREETGSSLVDAEHAVDAQG